MKIISVTLTLQNDRLCEFRMLKHTQRLADLPSKGSRYQSMRETWYAMKIGRGVMGNRQVWGKENGISRSFRKLLGKVLLTVHCDHISANTNAKKHFLPHHFGNWKTRKKQIVAYLCTEDLYRGLLHTFALILLYSCQSQRRRGLLKLPFHPNKVSIKSKSPILK